MQPLRLAGVADEAADEGAAALPAADVPRAERHGAASHNSPGRWRRRT